MRLVQSGPLLGLLAQPLLLGVLGATVGLGEVGWCAGLVCAAVTNSVLALGLARNRTDVLRPADWVTLTRAALACTVAALVAGSFVRPVSVPTLVGLTSVALVLDGVDGPGGAPDPDGVVAGWLQPWLRHASPPRPWAKVVARRRVWC
ncbi:MAG: hypothetical protein ACXVW2_14855 [Nocardioidaceae bacterium]